MSKHLQVTATVHSPGAMDGDPLPYAGPDSFTFVRVIVETPDGARGEGFTGRFLAPQVAHFLNHAVGPALADGVEPDPAILMKRFNPRAMTGVVVSGLSAFAIALMDLKAKQKAVTVAQLLGGARRSAPAHVTCGFPSLEMDALVETCGRAVADGAKGVKVLVAARGRSIADDAARLKAVREAIGDADLIADANCGMDDHTAMDFAKAVADLDLAWLEEPVHGNDRLALAKLAATGLVRLGAGQMEQSADRFALLAEAGVQVLQPNAVFCGGFEAAVSMVKDAIASGCRISPAGGWDLVNLQWMCGAMTDGAVELHRAQDRITRLLLGKPASLVDGQLYLPDRPGLGLNPDEDALAFCRVPIAGDCDSGTPA